MNRRRASLAGLKRESSLERIERDNAELKRRVTRSTVCPLACVPCGIDLNGNRWIHVCRVHTQSLREHIAQLTGCVS